MTDRTEHYALLESLFIKYVNQEALGEKDREEILHYADNNEFGIAFDYAMNMYTYGPLCPSLVAISCLEKIAATMKSEDFIRRLADVSKIGRPVGQSNC